MTIKHIIKILANQGYFIKKEFLIILKQNKSYLLNKGKNPSTTWFSAKKVIVLLTQCEKSVDSLPKPVSLFH